ncbi:GNAT family N-acetyltransferase [Dictyobacter arantiisoli]|uniref:N-acetyltransferase domain-containing protein n=1 Tax=Dictyobacter arantiisoli TaxID=2014874 RepID=A0A5A5TJU3_9CHLR|nr:GNAT family N-acetyltransferase [Dictyobacter arantiisoli]GCF11299.1 hypothetical protein KDI_48630 [Dictyobacter arantiisoli]
MDEGTPHIEVRAVSVSDAPALHELDAGFETDRIYALKVQNQLIQHHVSIETRAKATCTFELVETPVDPPLYKKYALLAEPVEEIATLLQHTQGGFVALMDGKLAGVIILVVEEERSVVRIQHMMIGRHYQRYKVGALLLSCAADWARGQKCWAILLETQNTHYPAVQFYLHNGFEIWGINCHFYPPGPLAHEVAITMGKRLLSTAEA